MATAAFFLFGTGVLIVGLIFVVLTLRHHYRLEKERQERSS